MSSFTNPGGIGVSPVTGKVFVADTNNHRVLRFPAPTFGQIGGNLLGTKLENLRVLTFNLRNSGGSLWGDGKEELFSLGHELAERCGYRLSGFPLGC